MPTVAVIDTNVWVSAFLNPHGAPARARQAFADGDFQAVISVPLLDEIARVLARPRLYDKYGLNQDEIAQFLQLLAQRGLPVIPTGNLRVCRDPDDDLLLEMALLGGASYVVSRDGDITRDQDLVAHMATYQIAVLTVQHFLDRLAAER